MDLSTQEEDDSDHSIRRDNLKGELDCSLGRPFCHQRITDLGLDHALSACRSQAPARKYLRIFEEN